MSRTETVSRGDRRSEIIRRWWRDLQDDRAARAALRRCVSVDKVQLLPVFHRLRLELNAAEASVNSDSLAAAAAVLSQVDEDVSVDESRGNFADSMSETSEGGMPRVSGLRFRRLLEISSPDERLVSIGRVVRHCQRKAPVASLGIDVIFWGDRVRKRWAYRYYERLPNAD